MKSDLSTDNLADLIARRHACLKQLHAIGVKQAELIAASDMTSLLRLVAGKQQLIAALQAIEHRLQPFHQQQPDDRQWSSASARAACAQQAAECRQMLDAVMQLEQANEAEMARRRDDVAQQLQSAETAARARGAYQAHQRHPIPGPLSDSGPPADAPAPARLDLSSDG